MPLFDPNKQPPCPFSAGDKVRFYAINYEEHMEISEKVRSGNFSFKMRADEF